MGAMKELFSSLEETSSALQRQEIPFDHPDSRCMFDGPLFSTPGALETHSAVTITLCIQELQALAAKRNGLDYLQVFRLPDGPLWIIDSGSYVTVLLPSEY